MSVSTISPKAMSPEECAQRLSHDDQAILIDVRSPGEFSAVHAIGAINLPLDSLDPEELKAMLNGRDDQTVSVICNSGSRSSMACSKLLGAGIENAISVEGGTHAWEEAGLEVVRGKGPISLERQVRIAAGSLVALGTFLGFALNPYFLAIPAFVGIGLVFAGVTGTCGMGMMLSKMPWNRVEKDSCQEGCSA